LPSYEERTEESTDTDLMIKSLPKGRKWSLSPTEVRHRQSKSKDRKESLSLRCCHKDYRERKIKSPDTVRHQQENATDSDNTDSSLSSKIDSERETPAKVYHSKHILKPPKFDGVLSFQIFWA